MVAASIGVAGPIAFAGEVDSFGFSATRDEFVELQQPMTALEKELYRGIVGLMDSGLRHNNSMPVTARVFAGRALAALKINRNGNVLIDLDRALILSEGVDVSS